MTITFHKSLFLWVCRSPGVRSTHKNAESNTTQQRQSGYYNLSIKMFYVETNILKEVWYNLSTELHFRFSTGTKLIYRNILCRNPISSHTHTETQSQHITVIYNFIINVSTQSDTRYKYRRQRMQNSNTKNARFKLRHKNKMHERDLSKRKINKASIHSMSRKHSHKFCGPNWVRKFVRTWVHKSFVGDTEVWR
jgi:hypothetical protein